MAIVENPDIRSIFKKYKSKIYSLVLGISRNEKDAEDILQNTFLKISKSLAGFRNDSAISTWIYRIAYNEALMYLRKRRAQTNLSRSGEFSITRPAAPDKELLDGELKGRLDAALKRMPIKYRMPLLLNMIEGLSIKDISGILGLKANSVKTRLRRARLDIKEDILDYFGDRLRKEERRDNKCGLLLGFVRNYASDALKKDAKDKFKRHIDDCRGCKSFLEQYLNAIKITDALECRDLPTELQNKIETFLAASASKY